MSIRLSKIYTKTGDKGETSLISGDRVPKNHLRIQAIGDVDETNATLGLVILQMVDIHEDVKKLLLHIQNDLFDLGADLALPETTEKTNILRMTKAQTDILERQIDHYNAQLKPLDSFVLPGGSETSTMLHLSRSVARRAERSAVALGHMESVNQFALQYLNRLSDLLFVLSRYCNDCGKRDVLWKPGAGREFK